MCKCGTANLSLLPLHATNIDCITSQFAGPHLGDERQPQEETDHGHGQNQQLPAVRLAQLLREQVYDGCGQAVGMDQLRMQRSKVNMSDQTTKFWPHERLAD